MTAQSGASVAQPSCPSCGETPMFRSVVHGCCVEIETLRSQLSAVVALHSQPEDGALAPGKWCPADGDVHPCPTLRAALAEAER